MYESDDEMVSHPNHYQSKSGLETSKVIEAFTEDLSGAEAVYTGNIIKYACRWKKKDGIRDLKKIMQYAQMLIDYVEQKEIDTFKNQDKTSLYCENPGFKIPEITWDPKSCTYKQVKHLEVPDYLKKESK